MTKFESIQTAFNAVMLNRRYNSDKDFTKRVSNNTRISYNNGVFAVVLHGTKVFSFDLNSNEITVNTGFWFTTTTRKTINDAAAACRQNLSVSFAKGCFNVNGRNYTDKNGYRLSCCTIPAAW